MRRFPLAVLPCAFLLGAYASVYAQTEPAEIYDNPPASCWQQASDGNLYAYGYMFNMTTYATPTAFPLPSCTFFQGTDGNFYAATSNTIVKVTLAGASTTVHTFSTSDGSGATAMIQGNDGNFYGVSSGGGAYGYGTLFTFTSAGGFTKLYDFTNNGDGEYPSSLIQASDGNLYGAGTEFFRANLAGTVTPLAPTGAFTSLTQGPNDLLYGLSPQNSGTLESISLTGAATQLADGDSFGLQFGLEGPCFLDGADNFYCSSGVVDNNETDDPEIFAVYSTTGNAVGNGYWFGVPGTFSGAFSATYSQAGDGLLYGVFAGDGNGSCGDECPPVSVDYLYGMNGGTTAPMTISFSPANVQPGQTSTLTWQTKNAYSDTMQQCFASGGWSGIKAASGSATITAPSTPGSYRYALTCGGVQTIAAYLGSGLPVVNFQSSLSAFAAGAPLTLTAQVTGGGPTPTGKVTFYYSDNGPQAIGSANLNSKGVATLSFNTTGVPAGSYELTCEYSGNADYAASSGGGLEMLAKKATVGVSASVTPNPVASGQTVTINGGFYPQGYSQFPSGTATFKREHHTRHCATGRHNIICHSRAYKINRGRPSRVLSGYDKL